MDKKTLEHLKKLRKTLRQQHTQARSFSKSEAAPLSDDLIFKRAMQGVKPLAGVAQFSHPAQPVSPWPRAQEPSAVAVDSSMSDFWPWDELQDGETMHFCKPGVRLDVLRKLKRGDFPISAQLDLHGETTETARVRVAEFLVSSLERQLHCVRIIHGKGLSSIDRTPVLKLRLKNWLAQRAEVLAFVQAKPAQGCAGAVLVLLKSGKKSR
jgi:DNA-nicking Smr family endonuclease